MLNMMELNNVVDRYRVDENTFGSDGDNSASGDSSLNDSLNDGARYIIDLMVENSDYKPSDAPYSADALESLNQLLSLLNPESDPAPTVGAAFRAIMEQFLQFDDPENSSPAA